MRYLLMICTDETGFAALSPAEAEASMAAYTSWSDEMAKSGVLQAGERLRPTHRCHHRPGTRDGEVLVADGPFAETKEQIGGYFYRRLQGSRRSRRRSPRRTRVPQHGTVEVKPIWAM